MVWGIYSVVFLGAGGLCYAFIEVAACCADDGRGRCRPGGCAQVAGAAEPSSAVEVSATSLAPGDTFTVTQTVSNGQAFTINGAKASLRAKELLLSDVADLVSCTGTIVPCRVFGGSYRGELGDVPAGESRIVVFTFKIKEDVAVAQFTLQHQFVGDDFSFETLDGPVFSIQLHQTDLAVSLNASARGLLVSRVTYTITVKNNGPATAGTIRLTATFPAGLVYSGSSDCTRVPGTRTLTCDVATLATGATATKRFTADAGLLTLGTLVASAERTQSTPGDPNPSNDRATRSCAALTGLLIRC
ncbi:MAG TPA: hypothetical protein VFG33_40870 [Kribbella sp.]|uniref:hypothetical protein n=1 Tax=Kribbella sp. TaxID=1871183 RepID=UPI002D76B466|nr:hypothetical protein [Kribbella sp.]HET6299786.1 hypothetical protein [Kribbella sp.]